MNKKHLTLIAIGLIVSIAILTNPKPETHKEAVKQKLHVAIQTAMNQEKTESNNHWENTGAALGMMLGRALIDQIVNNLITTNNYLLFSTTTVNWEGQSKTIGFGIFGNVYITTQLDDALNNGLLKTEIEN